MAEITATHQSEYALAFGKAMWDEVEWRWQRQYFTWWMWLEALEWELGEEP